MLTDLDLFRRYETAIMALPAGRPYTREELLGGRFLLHKENRFEMHYAPRSGYIPPWAHVVIIGITPGWSEMELSFRIARNGLAEGLGAEEIGKRLKTAAPFVGATRANLIAMLDKLGLHRELGLSGCGRLFEDKEDRVHTTALWPYPVFVSGKNYNGHSPSLTAAPFLRQSAVQSLSAELAKLDRPLLIPLGKAVEQMLIRLVDNGSAEAVQCLWGFPHPSGANGHRQIRFADGFSRMRTTLSGFGWNRGHQTPVEIDNR